MFNVLFSVCDSPKHMIEKQLSCWKNIPDEYRKNIQFILVDDHSHTKLDLNIDFPINLLIPRIDTDIYWNPPGAKNLAFLLADNDWTFNCDIDHTAEPETYIKMLTMEKKRNNVYFFTRWLPDGRPRNKDSSNLFLIHRNDWWKTGGYDEDFAGNHGYDDYLITGNFYNNEPGLSPSDPNIMKNLGFNFIRTQMKLIENKDGATGDEKKKIETNATNKAKLIYKINLLKENKYKHPSIFRFDWHIEKEYTF